MICARVCVTPKPAWRWDRRNACATWDSVCSALAVMFGPVCGRSGPGAGNVHPYHGSFPVNRTTLPAFCPPGFPLAPGLRPASASAKVAPYSSRAGKVEGGTAVPPA